jgi:hypothetical protein
MIPPTARRNIQQARAHTAAVLTGSGATGFDDYPDIRQALREATDWLTYADRLIRDQLTGVAAANSTEETT